MKPIKQTPFGKFLCWLGLHLLVSATHPNQDGTPRSMYGGCVRCNRGFGWDL